MTPQSKIHNPKSSLPLIVITGPTASGKSSLAMKLAEKWGGEIVCADSRTVYKDMDIGTAKPTKAEQERVRHWLLDVVEPSERFTAHDFQKQARDAIADIRSRGKIPFMVGGTGLYIDAVVLDYKFGPDADQTERRELEKMTIEQLKELLQKQHIPLPENHQNKRYLIRCYEKNNISTSSKPRPTDDIVVVAIATEKEFLQGRIARRADTMFAGKIVQETQRLYEKYLGTEEALTGNIYPIVKQMMSGQLTESEAKQLFVTRDWQLAKRQITWLKRHDFVTWLPLAEAEHYLDHILSEKS